MTVNIKNRDNQKSYAFTVLNLSLIQFLYVADNLQKLRKQKKILDCTNKLQ